MAISIDSRRAAAAFKAIVDQVGRDDVADILLNWNDYELSEDGNKIICHIGRDPGVLPWCRGREGYDKQGGVSRVAAK